jgi:hypothetical protein
LEARKNHQDLKITIKKKEKKKKNLIANDELLLSTRDYNHYVICSSDEAVKNGTIVLRCKFEKKRLKRKKD